ncbi:MAG: 4-hydroxy-3-methylbut-2-enyl diphosphate reductase, partial [Actinomycetota bacterium]|nr:4-hydroxy-3-methylbut-2-enyl diphosphate reductase [Actinomycetota bacterium]
AGTPAAGVAVAGFGGATTSALEPGDLVVASELRTPGGTTTITCPGAGMIAGMLRRRGVSAHVGPIVSVRSPATGSARAALASTGALAVDMESAWLAGAGAGRPLVVVRAVLDTPRRELFNPIATAGGLLAAARALRAAAGVLAEWADAIAPRELVLGTPRASCAGVERAIEVVERVLERYGPPVYMRRQIVHNRHVVADLERRGAICVEEFDEVPDGATVVFSAHGVSPRVREQARRRKLNAVDATCPLVSKVHAEARRFAKADYTIVLVGHQGHEEIEGTTGEAPGAVRVIAGEDQVQGLQVRDPHRVAYLTQTTLAVDETKGVVDRLRERFPEIEGPRSDDICYATQNRQDAVKALASDCDLVLVIGSRNSSNSNRLVEVAERHGCRARLIDDETELQPDWLAHVRRVGLTAGASCPERLVQRVVAALRVLGPLELDEQSVATETVAFALPREVRD